MKESREEGDSKKLVGGGGRRVKKEVKESGGRQWKSR